MGNHVRPVQRGEVRAALPPPGARAAPRQARPGLRVHFYRDYAIYYRPHGNRDHHRPRDPRDEGRGGPVR